MKIRKLKLKNIGVFDDETIEFQPCPTKDKAEIHIFTGQNGTGKTTLLMSLASSFERDFDKRFHLKNSLEKRFQNSQNNTIEIFFKINNEEKEINDHPTVTITKGDSDIVILEPLFLSQDPFVWGIQFNETIVSPLSFAGFAYSGYRRLKDEKINLFGEIEEGPLNQALDFVKDDNSKFTLNQWLGRSLSKRALALEDNNEDASKFTKNIKTLEKVLSNIVSYDIRFKLKTDLSLVLIKDDLELDFDVLPDGLKSLISWIGDLLMRLDSLKWENDTPIFEREIILFLDEIEVHLHPAWQRKVLPVVQKLFKNSQIFVSTHSPFVVNSVDDAWVYKLELENGKAKVADVMKSEDGYSYSYVLEEIFGVKEEFGVGVQKELDEFYRLRNAILGNGSSEKDLTEIIDLAENIAKQSEELNTIVQIELRQINRRKGLNLKI